MAASPPPGKMSDDLDRELAVQRIELEMQNEELLHAHLATEAARDRYFDLFELAPVAYLAVDRTSTVCEANRAASALLGIEPHKLPGSKVSGFVGERDVAPFNLLMRRVFESREKHQSQIRLSLAGGREISTRIEAVFRPEGDSSGSGTALVTIVDLSEVHASELARRASEDLLQSVFDNAGSGIFIAVAEGHLVTANDAACRFLGYRLDELRGVSIWNVTHPDDRDENRREFERALRLRARTDLETRYLTKDGRPVWGHVTASWIVDATGTPLYTIGLIQDITRRKSIEKQLHHEREYLRSVLEGANDAIFTFTATGLVETFNCGAERIFGWSAHAIVGRNIETILSITENDSPDGVTELILDMGRREVTGRRRDGSEFPLQLSITRVDHLSVFTCIGQDISLRKEAERRFQRESQFNSQLISTAQTVILVLDPEGRIVMFNPHMVELGGYTLTEVRGHDWFETFLAGDEQERKRLRQAFARVLSGAKLRDLVSTIVTKGGEHRVLRWSSSALKDASNTTVGVLAIGEDISEHHRTQRALASTMERYRTVINIASDAIITIDSSGTIDSFNPAAERIFGYREEEVAGANVSVIMPSPERDEHDRYLSHYLQTGVSKIIGVGREVRGRRKDGTLVPVFLQINQMNIDGEIRFCAFLRDLTTSKLAERQLRQAQKLEAVGTLASAIAHDFNNLLMGVSGCIHIALDTVDACNPAHLYLEEVRKSADKGAAIVQQLLTFSRKAELAPATFELNAVISGNEKMLRRLLGENIEIIVNLGASDSRVLADMGQIDQAIMNLAVNARDAMPDGGFLTLETASVILEQETQSLPAGSYVALRVRDDGCGMSETTREHLFEPFFTTKGIGKGTGLGLSTVYGIVKQSKGNITVETELGRGTTFEILLPLARNPVTQEIPVMKEFLASPRGCETVLLLEDDRTVRLGLRHYLETAGYRVLEAQSGPEAVECCERFSGTIELLLTDVMLPKMTGSQVAAEVRRLRPDVTVLFISAHPVEWLCAEGRIDEGVNVLQKPFSETNLLTTIRAVLDGKAAVP
jgi:PAS domain S-box-containing protein